MSKHVDEPVPHLYRPTIFAQTIPKSPMNPFAWPTWSKAPVENKSDRSGADTATLPSLHLSPRVSPAATTYPSLFTFSLQAAHRYRRLLFISLKLQFKALSLSNLPFPVPQWTRLRSSSTAESSPGGSFYLRAMRHRLELLFGNEPTVFLLSPPSRNLRRPEQINRRHQKISMAHQGLLLPKALPQDLRRWNRSPELPQYVWPTAHYFIYVSVWLPKKWRSRKRAYLIFIIVLIHVNYFFF